MARDEKPIDMQAPAFPEPADTQYSGMTLLDYFAAKHAHALRLASFSDEQIRDSLMREVAGGDGGYLEAIARDAYRMAAAMMRVRGEFL